MVNTIRALIVIGLLFGAAPAHAQTDPVPVVGYNLLVFAPGAAVDGDPIATLYFRADAATCVPRDLTAPAAEQPTAPSGVFELKPGLTEFLVRWDLGDQSCTSANIAGPVLAVTSSLPPGRYPWALQSTSSITLAPELLGKPSTDACVPPAGKASILALTVTSTYPQTIGRGKRTHVDFYVSNVWSIVELAASVDGRAVANATGANLKDIGGLWFTAPSTPGDHQVTVYARDAAGCEYRSGLVRTLKVQF